ncbi:MAG: hypothetical protein KGL35_31205 [Bradyrhizobium sp.]|nr:hypothetical protein [Bradyrhizobium sp.]
MISRDQARAIAESALLARGWKVGVCGISDLSEGRGPRIYAGPDLRRCWFAYVDDVPIGTLASGSVVLVDKETGQVLYIGGSHEEG